MSPLHEVLAAGGAPVALAATVTSVLGPHADAELAEDPWRLLSVPGVRPEQADGYARSLLGPVASPEDPRRARALVGWLLERAARAGHSAVPAATVRRALPAFGFANPEAALAAVVADGGVLALDGPGDDHVLALDRCAMAEESLHEGVSRLLATARHLGPPDAVTAAMSTAAASEALRAAATTGVSIAVPATARATETLVADLAGLAEAAGQRLLVATATDRAAARLREITGATVTTTRRLADGVEQAAGLVLVTEAAALGAVEASAVVEGLADGVHLVLAGDPAGLCSPGPGRVLADLAESGRVPVSAVSPRLADRRGTVLADLAAGIRAGALPPVDSPDREVVVVPARDGGEAAHRSLQLIADSIPRALGIPVADILVVTPRRAGAAGADAINAAGKERLNPGPGKFAGFDPGDRVVVASASFAAAPYGEIGTVVGGTEEGLDLEFTSGPVAGADAGALRLGWAVTAQQAIAAGSWPAVVAVFPGEAAGSLSRALVLSCVSGALSHLSVVHAAGPALAHAVARAPRRDRTTSVAQLGL
jgi:hypothetical protein